MRLRDLPTPCLVLDRTILARNLRRMADVAGRHGVALRPHMKTAKSVEVGRLAMDAGARGITVSTLAEAEYFARAGFTDMIYAVGITPQKLDRVAALNAAGADVAVITDDPEAARAIAAKSFMGRHGPMRALIEVDSGEHRGGMAAADARLLAVADALGGCMAGVLTHAGHSYAGRTPEEMAGIAETERAAIVGAAARLRQAGYQVAIVSMGSSPTARHARHLEGVTELRAGVYMFGDLFQAGIHTHGLDDIALTVLASVIGRRAVEHRFVVDAGGLALSKDRSTQAGPVDYGFGLVLGADGRQRFGRATVLSAYQEHGIVAADPERPFPALSIGDQVRIAPNHTCMTAAAHNRYYVVDGAGSGGVGGDADEVVAVWDRVNGW